MSDGAIHIKTKLDNTDVAPKIEEITKRLQAIADRLQEISSSVGGINTALNNTKKAAAAGGEIEKQFDAASASAKELEKEIGKLEDKQRQVGAGKTTEAEFYEREKQIDDYSQKLNEIELKKTLGLETEEKSAQAVQQTVQAEEQKAEEIKKLNAEYSKLQQQATELEQTGIDTSDMSAKMQKIYNDMANVQRKLAEIETDARGDVLRNQFESAARAAQKLDDEIEELQKRQDKLRASPTYGTKFWSISSQREYDELSEKVSALTGKQQQAHIKEETAQLRLQEHDQKRIDQMEKLRAEYERLGKVAEETAAKEEAVANKAEKAHKKMAPLAKSLKNTFRMFGRMILRQAFWLLLRPVFQAIRNYFSGLIKQTPELAKALGRLKGAFLTAFQPIMQTVLPSIIKLINWLATAINYIGAFISALLGVPYGEAAENAQELYEGTQDYANAQHKANKELAAFDRIIKLSGGLGGAGGAGIDEGQIHPIFENIGENEKLQKFIQWVQDHLEEIKKLAKLIGTVLAAWAISSLLGTKLSTTLGVISTIWGLAKKVKGTFDAWENGVDWDNLQDIFWGDAGIITGLTMIFGKEGLTAGLLVTGIPNLVTGIKDAFEQGGLTEANMTLIIGGLLQVGAGLSMATGSPIPLLISAIGSLLIAMAAARIDLDTFWYNARALIIDPIQKWFHDMFPHIVPQYNEPLPIPQSQWNRVKELADQLLGLGMSVEEVVAKLREEAGKPFGLGGVAYQHALYEYARILETNEVIRQQKKANEEAKSAAIWDARVAQWNADAKQYREMFSRATDEQFEARQQLSVLAEIMKANGELNPDLENLLDTCIDALGKGLVPADKTLDVVNKILNGTLGIDEALGLIKKEIEKGIKFRGGGGGKPGAGSPTVSVNSLLPQPVLQTARLPHLASGQVIPPNAPFAAILGDQRSGLNIETPLATMEEAFINALRKAGIGGVPVISFQGDLAQLGKVLQPVISKETRRLGVNFAQ